MLKNKIYKINVALYNIICNYIYKLLLNLVKKQYSLKKLGTSKLFIDFIKVIRTLEFANTIFKIKGNSLRLDNLETYVLCTKL